MIESKYLIDATKVKKKLRKTQKSLPWLAHEMGYESDARIRQILEFGEKPLLQKHYEALKKALGEGDWFIPIKKGVL